MATIADLERTVTASIDDGKFDVMSAVTLLQKYNTTKAAAHNVGLIVRMLAAATATFNKNEVDLLLAQIPVSVQKGSAAIERVLQAENALQCGQFVQFWSQWADVKTVVAPAIPTFEKTLKATIGEILSQSFVKISAKEAAAMLNSADAKELSAFGGKVEGEYVVFPSTSLNDPKPHKKEPLTLERLLPVIGK